MDSKRKHFVLISEAFSYFQKHCPISRREREREREREGEGEGEGEGEKGMVGNNGVIVLITEALETNY